MLLKIASINFGRLNKIRVKNKMSRNEKKGQGGKHTGPKKWSGARHPARRPAGPAMTALIFEAFFSLPLVQIWQLPVAVKVCMHFIAQLYW